MPSQKILEQKQEFVAELADKLKGTISGVIVKYEGITVVLDTQLRKKLREAGVEYAVVKNTLLRRAAAVAELEGLDDVLAGTTALALSPDHTTAAKILSEFAEKNKMMEIKAGFVEGKVISAADVDELAKMPSKEVLIAKTLGGFNAPITGFVGVLNANLRGLVVALNAIATQQGA